MSERKNTLSSFPLRGTAGNQMEVSLSYSFSSSTDMRCDWMELKWNRKQPHSSNLTVCFSFSAQRSPGHHAWLLKVSEPGQREHPCCFRSVQTPQGCRSGEELGSSREDHRGCFQKWLPVLRVGVQRVCLAQDWPVGLSGDE